MTFYICNGQNPLCCNSTGCHNNGGNCWHTANEAFSETEHCDDPQRHPERFEAEVFTKLPTYYFERKGYYDEKKEECNA